MAILCPRCGAEFDATLFEFEHRVRCECGAEIRYPGSEGRGGHVTEEEVRHRRNDRGAAEAVLEIDGSQGEGGGQILRTSLALALVTGKAFVIANIRANRRKPGLRLQHLGAVRAAAELSRARVDGDQLGSQRVVFCPGNVEAGDFSFSVESAGSATLVLQTVLPALLVADGESNLTLRGGTHNPLAPPFDFLAKSYLPLVHRLGPTVEARLVRPGFYPAGGGEFRVRVQPARRLGRLDLIERGEILARRVRVLLANLPRHIAERECRTIARQTGWSDECFAIEEVPEARGPGNAVMIEIEARHVTEVFTSFGRIGVKAEEVAREALREAEEYLASDAPVGRRLADQIMLPMAIGAYLGGGGGAFRTLPLSDHATTQMDILRQFLGSAVTVEVDRGGSCLVKVG